MISAGGSLAGAPGNPVIESTPIKISVGNRERLRPRLSISRHRIPNSNRLCDRPPAKRKCFRFSSKVRYMSCDASGLNSLSIPYIKLSPNHPPEAEMARDPTFLLEAVDVILFFHNLFYPSLFLNPLQKCGNICRNLSGDGPFTNPSRNISLGTTGCCHQPFDPCIPQVSHKLDAFIDSSGMVLPRRDIGMQNRPRYDNEGV